MCQVFASFRLAWGLAERYQNIPLDGAGLSLEKVGNKDFVFVVLVAGRENIGALNGLVEEPKDIVDYYDAFVSIFGSGDVWRTN